MNMNEYQAEAVKTRQPVADLNYCLGKIATEGGEAWQLWLKCKYHGKPFDRAAAVEEIGDVLWYVANACDLLGVDLATVAAGNIAKLRTRHGTQYSPAHYQPVLSPAPMDDISDEDYTY